MKRIDPMLATAMFITSAVGRIVAGATAKNAMIARYADAPAWPPDE